MSVVEFPAHVLPSPHAGTRARTLGDGGHMAVAAFAAAALATMPFVLHHRAYFNDDQQTQYVPVFMAIGKALLGGHWPLLSLHAAYGGDLVGEYQYGLFNPLTLALAAIASTFRDMAAAAALFAIVHYAMLGAGVFVLARACGANRVQSHVAVCAIATNSFLFYWYASSWLPGLLSLAPVTLACAFLLRASETRASFVAAIVFTALTVTSGWPHTLLMLGVFTALSACVLAFDRRFGAALAAAGAAAIGLSLSAIAPAQVVALAAAGARSTAEASNSGLFVPNLSSVLSLSSPFQVGTLQVWEGDLLPTYAPIFNVGWYVLPLAPFLDWRASAMRPAFRIFALFGATALLATQGPSFLFGLRLPLRFLPFFHLALLVVVAAALSQPMMITRGRAVLSGILIALGACLSWQALPTIGSTIVLSNLLVVGGTMLMCRYAARSEALRASVLAAGVVCFFVVVHLAMPKNPVQPGYDVPSERGAIVDITAAPKSFAFYSARYKEFIGWTLSSFPAGLTQALPLGNLGLVQGLPAFINGYSPIGHEGFRSLFKLETHGVTQAQIAPILLMADPATGASFADLLRVDEIRARKGPVADAAAARIDDAWTRADSASTVGWTRALPNAALPGTVSWHSYGFTIGAGDEAATAQTETVHIAARSGGTDALIFARLAWPGYRAFLEGREVPVKTHEDFLLRVELPPDVGTGVLRLEFGLSFLRPCLALAIAGLMALLAGLVVGRFGVPHDDVLAS